MHYLSKSGELEPNETLDNSITLTIENPKKEKTYKMGIYVRCEENPEILSESLEITIKFQEELSESISGNKNENEINKEEDSDSDLYE